MAITMSVGEQNPHLQAMKSDFLYHIGLSTADVDFKAKFGDVKFVITGGSRNRLFAYAGQLAKSLQIKADLTNMAGPDARFGLYKVGPALFIEHGMGVPSLSIMLHETIKLVRYAGCKDVTFIRMGTSGGLGVEMGTVVVTNEAFNTALKPIYNQNILGKDVEWSTQLSNPLTKEFLKIAETLGMEGKVIGGNTVCANDFYEEQSRLDGAFCSFSAQDRQNYLEKAYSLGVRNFEMECTAFYAFCKRAGINAAIVCVTLLNRMNGDQVNFEDKKDYTEFQQRPGKLITEFIKHHM